MDGVDIIHIRNAAVFTNIMKIKKVIQEFSHSQHLIIDFSSLQIIDHTAMSMLHQLKEDFAEEGRLLEIQGLDKLQSVSSHPLSARKINR